MLGGALIPRHLEGAEEFFAVCVWAWMTGHLLLFDSGSLCGALSVAPEAPLLPEFMLYYIPKVFIY